MLMLIVAMTFYTGVALTDSYKYTYNIIYSLYSNVSEPERMVSYIYSFAQCVIFLMKKWRRSCEALSCGNGWYGKD